ncbi:MAG: DUF3667 domain-containing protein [Sphingobium sp.]|nr:DUF3667 domain-containing protein [Sphingobium sp.]
MFHFEGKIWRTLPELFLRPGKLTRRYIDGERAKFVSPMALFLFSVFLMFAVFSFTGGALLGNHASTPQNGNPVRLVEKLNAEMAALRRERATPGLTNEQIEVLDSKIDTLKDRRNDLEVVSYNWKDALALEIAKTDGRIADVRAELTTPDLKPERKLALEKRLKSFEQDRAATAALRDNDWAKLNTMGRNQGGGDNFTVNTGWKGFDEKLNEGLKKANTNPDLVLYKLKTDGYKFSWALIPISLPFVWLLFFWRRDIHLYDHAIFTTYSLCFVMLLTIAASLVVFAGIDSGWMMTLILLAIPFHMYKQLKHTYGLSRGGALTRTVLLLFFTFFALMIFELLLLSMGVLA